MPEPSNLGLKQELFVELKAKLIEYILSLGYKLRPGESLRSDEQSMINAMGFDGRTELCNYLEQNAKYHGLALSIANNGKANGILMSNHRIGLAEDFNLFKNGNYLTKTEDWKIIGEWWEKLHPLCRWGGRFNDGNHFSLEHEGRK
jgi:hypothetical protein